MAQITSFRFKKKKETAPQQNDEIQVVQENKKHIIH